MSAEEILQQACHHHQAGRLAEAEDLYRQVLAEQPNHATALHLLGTIALAMGRFDDAIELHRHAIASNPSIAEFYRNLGIALAAKGEFQQAIECYRAALRLAPSDARTHFHLAAALRSTGRLAEAIESSRAAIAIDPNHVEAILNLALCLSDSGQWEQAAAAYAQAARLRESLAADLLRIGDFHSANGRFDEAAAAYQGLLSAQSSPQSPAQPSSQSAYVVAAMINLGNVLHAVKRDPDAIEYYLAALRLRPGDAAAWTNLGNSLEACNCVEEAIAAHRRAIEFSPDLAGAYTNLARALKDRMCLDEVLACYRKAIALQPDLQESYTGLLLCLHYAPNITPREIFAAHLDWAKKFAEPLTAAQPPGQTPLPPFPLPWYSGGGSGRGFPPTAAAPPPARCAAAGRRLRIGYVSPDFVTHPIAHFIEPILRHHDRNRFEVFCYANNAATDPLGQRLRSSADHWRSIFAVPDEQATQIIRRDEIDLLVDLAGHTSGTRLLLFARKPAPVQISWLGYQDTTGMSAIDFRITDAHCDPPGMTEQWHTEKLLRLPHSFFCYQPPDESPADVGSLPALSRGSEPAVTFASLNNFAKVHDDLLAVWSRILHRVPRSRLLIFISDGPAGGAAVMDHFTRAGIAPARLEFVSRQPLADYMMLHQRLDIALDPFPCSGHTTMCHALWMGVPTVTLEGKTYVSRMGVSIMKSMSLPELIAHSVEDYIDIAVNLATELPRLAELRRTLRGRMKQSPLMNERQLVRDLEALYEAVM